MREKLGQVLVELGIVGDDHSGGSSHGLIKIAGGERGPQPLFGFRRRYEDEARRRAIGARRTKTGEIVDFAQPFGRNGLGQPSVVGAGFTEELVEGGV